MTEFTLLSKFRDSNKHDETKAVDIVGVHSIRGPPSESWKAEDGSFWLNDLLPKDLKHARIFSFGFVHSDIISDPSKNFNYVVGILFNAIVDARSNVPSARPLILMCHGIGGLLVEGVLLRSKLDVLVKEHNVSLRPETLKILPKVKSNWSLKCFSDREEDGYKLLVKDIKKVLKGSAKSVEMDAGKPKPQPGGHHRLDLPNSEGPLEPCANHRLEIGVESQAHKLSEISLSYENSTPASNQTPLPHKEVLSPFAAFSASAKDTPFFHQTSGRQGDASGYPHSVSATETTTSPNETANTQPYHLSNLAQADNTRDFNTPTRKQSHMVNQRLTHTSPSFNQNLWKLRSPDSLPFSTMNQNQQPGLDEHVPPLPIAGSRFSISGIGPTKGPMSSRPLSKSIESQSSHPPKVHPHPQPQHIWRNGPNLNHYQAPIGIQALGAHLTQSNCFPMFRPPEHGPPQGRNMGPPSTSVQPNKPDNIPKIQKKATVTKDSEASKNSKFPKEPKTQNRAHTSLMSNRLSASRSPKSRTASQEHGFFGVPKTQYHAGLTISAPAVKALGTEQNHTDPKKPGSLSKLLKRGVNKEDPNSEHASHNHSAHNHAGKGQSGHKHSGKSHPPKGHKDHSHSAKSPTLKSHARHARSHSNHSHGKHGNDKHSHKHRPGSSSSSSSASTSNASTKSGSSGSSQSSSAEEEPGRFRKFFGFGSKRNDTGSVNSSGSEESDYEEHGVNPNENMMSGGFHGGSNCKADTRPENSSKVRGKQARSSYDSGSGSASDDNSSISNVSMISGDGMNSGLDDVDYD